MPSTNGIRNTLTDPKPLYFAAGVIDKIREEAPERIAAVRATDPKQVQARFTKQAKETQAKVSETLGSLDTDIKRLREQAQHVALQGVGIAAEYAVKAREAYDELADRGRGAVKGWRNEESGTTEVTVEREPVKVAEPPAEPRGSTRAGTGAGTGTAAGAGSAGATGAASARNGTAGTARRTTTAKTTESKTTKSQNTDSKPADSKSGSAKGGNAKGGNAKPGNASSNGSGQTPPKSES